MDRLLDTLAFVRKRRFTLDGLVALLVLVGGLWYLFAKVVGPHLLHIVKAVGWSAPDDVAHACFLAGFFGVMLLAFWLWRRYRSVPKFGKGELGIIFAPDFGEDIRDDVDRLFVHLKQEIKSSELGNAFGLKRLPPNLSISCPSEATAMLGESRGAVAVWGPLEQQSDAQGRTTGFSKIHLTFVVRAPRIPKRHLEFMAMSFLGRQFHVRDRTLIADRKIMARDIGLVVRNVLGVALVLGLDFQEAVKVLRPLHQDLRGAFSGKQSVPSQRFCLQVRQDLAHSLTMASTIQYHKFLLDNKLYAIPSEFLEGWLNNVDQAISLDPQNSIHYLSKAIYLFLQGNVDGAIRAEKQAEWHSPRAASIANFGLAFLYNFKGDFRQSGRQYRTALAKKTSYEEGMIHQCLAFTRQSIARFPEKKQLRLALAVLELERGSSERGMQALQEFLADLPHPGELLEFVAEAKRLLEAARSSEESSGTADGLEKTPP